jgi:chromate transporter
MTIASTPGAPAHRSPLREVFLAFLRLGLTSFGGPIAHLGYFRAEFVERRAWLDEPAYADIVALCQFLPGPASSQVGIALALHPPQWIASTLRTRWNASECRTKPSHARYSRRHAKRALSIRHESQSG